MPSSPATPGLESLSPEDGGAHGSCAICEYQETQNETWRHLLFESGGLYRHGGLRPFHHESTCIAQLALGPCRRAPLPPDPRVCRRRTAPRGVAPSVSEVWGSATCGVQEVDVTGVGFSRLTFDCGFSTLTPLSTSVASLLATPKPEGLSPDGAHGSCAICFSRAGFWTVKALYKTVKAL